MTPHEFPPAEAPNYFRKALGPYYLIDLEQDGVAAVRLAVSVLATDVIVDGGRILYTGNDRARGNEFRWDGIPLGERPLTAEEVASSVTELTGRRVAAVPTFFRRDAAFFATMGFWRVRLERPVFVSLAAADNQGVTTRWLRDIYVDQKGDVFASTGSGVAINEMAGLRLSDRGVMKVIPALDGTPRHFEIPPNVSIPIDLAPVISVAVSNGEEE